MGDGARAMPLVKMWEQPGFRERLVVAVEELEATRKAREAREEEVQRLEAASALVMMKEGEKEAEEEEDGVNQYEIKITIELSDDDE